MGIESCSVKNSRPTKMTLDRLMNLHLVSRLIGLRLSGITRKRRSESTACSAPTLMNQTSVTSIIFQSIARAALAAAGTAGAVVYALLGGIFSGNAKESLFFASLVALFGAGWALLPAVRASRVCTVLALVAWGTVAVFLARFGEPTVRGWMLQPWAVATAGLAACLAIKPPAYIRSSSSIGEGPQ